MSFAPFNVLRNEQAKPPEKVGIGGFNTYATVNERVSGTRVLPTSVLESGRYANDDVIIEPLIVDLIIDVADTFIELGESQSPVKEPLNISGVISQFIPARTKSQLNRISNIVNNIQSVRKKISSSLDFYSSNSSVTKKHREQFVEVLNGLYNSDAIIDLQTKFKTYENMTLATFDYEVNNEEQSIKAQLSFQQLDFRDLVDVAVTAVQKKPSPAAAAITGSPSDKGAQGATSGKKADERKTKSVLTSVLGR